MKKIRQTAACVAVLAVMVAGIGVIAAPTKVAASQEVAQAPTALPDAADDLIALCKAPEAAAKLGDLMQMADVSDKAVADVGCDLVQNSPAVVEEVRGPVAKVRRTSDNQIWWTPISQLR